ncbi:hypothetical protein BC830DRAFT_673605 [Chytriomyces sp. MP71]|nr:hypothetical protein BC830DRAFT_673605 [Chytriomyces sp. MP71]
MTPLRMTGHGHTGLEPPDSSDAHLSYLHCNRCGFCAHSVRLDADEGLPTTMSGETHLFVAQCSHLLCSNCLNPPPGFNGRSSVAHTCPLCNATSAIVRLDDQIPPDVSKIISPCMEGLENAMECAKFQFGNAVALIQYLKTCRNTQVAALKTAIKTHVELRLIGLIYPCLSLIFSTRNSLAQTSRIQTLTSENESLKQEIASIQHKLSRQQISHQQQPRLHTSAPQIKTHLPAATPLFSVPPPMQPRNLENQQQHDQLPFKHQQSNQHAPRQVQQRASHPHSPQQPFSNQHMQPIPPYSRSETPISISYTSNVSSRAVTPAPMDRSNTQAPSYASNALRQQHIQTPIPPARLSLPRPGSAMSGTSGPGSVSSASPRGSMIQFQVVPL